jgi:hypothetical protein
MGCSGTGRGRARAQLVKGIAGLRQRPIELSHCPARRKRASPPLSVRLFEAWPGVSLSQSDARTPVRHLPSQPWSSPRRRHLGRPAASRRWRYHSGLPSCRRGDRCAADADRLRLPHRLQRGGVATSCPVHANAQCTFVSDEDPERNKLQWSWTTEKRWLPRISATDHGQSSRQ